MKRREFVATAGGAAALSATASTAAAQDGDGEGGGGGTPDFGGYISGAKGGTFVDARGQSEVTVEVGAGSGGLAFTPTGLWIDPGTTVLFEWVSNGHNVIVEEGPGDWTGVEAIEGEGFEDEFTFETGGIYKYFCSPHKGLGMLGAIAVGDDVPTTGGGEGGESGPINPEEIGVPFQAHFVGIATLLGIAVSLLFAFYALKYGESAHSSSPNRK
jgi:halocyanin-like protein